MPDPHHPRCCSSGHCCRYPEAGGLSLRTNDARGLALPGQHVGNVLSSIALAISAFRTRHRPAQFLSWTVIWYALPALHWINTVRDQAPWTTPGSLEAVGSGKDQGHGSSEEVPGGAEGTRRRDGA